MDGADVRGNGLPVAAYLPGFDPAPEVDFQEHVCFMDTLR
jgi:hypothetical protein